MGVSQTKRTQGHDNTIVPGAQTVFTNTSEDACNIHGLILDLLVGGLSTGLNFGHWALCLLPRSSTAVPVITTTNLNSEIDSPVMWMLGTWMLNNDSISHIGGAPKSSRNCPRGGRLVAIIESSVLSASNVRVHGNSTWFETIR